jgi:hypothetical protein
MEVPQGNLSSYLKQEKMSFFFFNKIREQEGRTGPAWGVGNASRKEEEVGKRVETGEYGEILCTHVCK